MTNFTEAKMGESKRQKYKARLGIVTTVLLIILLVYFAFQIFGEAGTRVSLIKTQLVTDEHYLNLHGYVYRDEELIHSADNEIAELLVVSGEKIPVGKEYLKLHRTNISGEVMKAGAQGELNDLSDRIDALTDSFDSELRVQDIDRVNAFISSSYYAFLSSVSGNNYPAATVNGEQMLDFMNQQQIITGKLASLRDTLSELIAEKKALIDGYATSSKTVTNDVSCHVYRYADGYEDAFSYTSVMTMTAEQFRESIKNVQYTEYKNVAAKRVYSSKWYLAVPITYTNSQLFEVGGIYPLILSEADDTPTLMTVERIEMPEDAGSGFIVFSSGEIDKSFDVSRYTSVKFLRSSVSGFRVPESAVLDLDADGDGYPDYTGVYVMSGNYAKFRRIKVLSYESGYVIAKDSDYIPEGTEEKYPYLLQSELIIVSGGNLYDGKLIK